jgi:hypothetical protein
MNFPKATCTFLGMPLEIRRKIYFYLLVSQKKITMFGMASTRLGRKVVTDANGIDPRILATSRQCHKEAGPILYGANAFGITCIDAFEFFSSISSTNTALLKHVSFMTPVAWTERGVCMHWVEDFFLILGNVRQLEFFFPLVKNYDFDRTKAELLWQELKGTAELTKLLPRPHSTSSKWIRRWLPDRRYIHLWYVRKDFKLTKLVIVSPYLMVSKLKLTLLGCRN